MQTGAAPRAAKNALQVGLVKVVEWSAKAFLVRKAMAHWRPPRRAIRQRQPI
jgi:hypothetical protein